MIYCVNCGAANPQEARFCYRCGRAIMPTPAALSESSPPESSASATIFQTPVEIPPLSSPSFPAVGPNFQTIYFPYNPNTAPDYLKAGPELVKIHPLAEGIMGFPYDLQARPREFYSYMDAQERLVFARRAGFWKRFLATLVDLLLLFVPFLFLAYANYKTTNNGNTTAVEITSRATPNPEATAPLTYAFFGLIFVYFLLTGILGKGQSIGKRTQKLRVMRLDGRKPDLLTGTIRYTAGYLLSTNVLVFALVVLLLTWLGLDQSISGFIGIFFFGWGFWWAGWDSRKQGWHDKLARTLVVDTREYVEGFQFFREPKGDE